MELVYHILFLTFNSIFFLLSFILIIKRRKHPAISVRSPVLLFFNNFGGFLMTNIFLIYEMLEDFYDYKTRNSNNFNLEPDENFYLFCKIVPNNFIICHFLMIFSFILRCQRVLACSKINNDERIEIEEFYKERYKFRERYYIKILFFLMCMVTFINFWINLQFGELILIPVHFEKCTTKSSFNRYNTLEDNGNINYNQDTNISGVIPNNYNNYNTKENNNFNENDNTLWNKHIFSDNYNYNAIILNKDTNSDSDFDKKNRFNYNILRVLGGSNRSELKFLADNLVINPDESTNSNFLQERMKKNKNTKNLNNKNERVFSSETNEIEDALTIKRKIFFDIQQDALNSIKWILLNFIEHIILITYSYFLSVNPIKQLIKLELNTFFGIWIIYPNFLRFNQFFIQNNNSDFIEKSHWTSYACVFFLYLCLIINGYVPIITSYIEEKKLNYHFIPKLANNLYLFLSNEICFKNFYEFILNSENENLENFSINSRSPLENDNLTINNISDKGLFFLGLYTDIIKYKLSFSLEPDDDKVIENARKVYDYFSNADTENNRKNKLEKYFEVDIINKTKSHCLILNQNKFDYDMFDDALAVTFKNLNEIFFIYKKSEDFQILIDNLTLNSYIHCKMYNTGLINKY